MYQNQKLEAIIGYIVLAYVILATLGLILAGRTIYRQRDQINVLEAKTNEIRVCGLNDVVCPGEETKPVEPAAPAPKAKPSPLAQKGTTKASWYHYTLNGVQWSQDHRTVASRDFKRGTMLKVCRTIGVVEFEKTGDLGPKCVEVVVNDYGPSAAVHPDRGLDLSWYAFSQIANPNSGVIQVEYEVIAGDGGYVTLNK